jgi:hypothetical protein
MVPAPQGEGGERTSRLARSTRDDDDPEVGYEGRHAAGRGGGGRPASRFASEANSAAVSRNVSRATSRGRGAHQGGESSGWEAIRVVNHRNKFSSQQHPRW